MIIDDKAALGAIKLEKCFEGGEDMHSGENVMCLQSC